MRFERTKNASRTFIFGVISRIITIIGPFITRTIIIHKLGAAYTGLSGLFTSVLTVLSISELGIGAAASYCLYEPVAKDDKKTICALLNHLRKLYNIIGTVILICGVVIIPYLPRLIKTNTPPEINIYILYIIYLLDTSVSYLAFAYKEVLFKAYQRGDITHKIRASIEVVKYILQITILLVFPNYYTFCLILLASEIVYTVFVGYTSRKYYPDLKPKGVLADSVIKVFRNKVMFLSVHAVSTKLINSADNIIISSFISLEAVTLYGNYSYISSSILGIILIAYTAIHPIIGNVIYTENDEKKYEIFNGLWLLSSWIVMWCMICMACLYQPFITFWLNNDFLLPETTMILICLFFCANSMNQFLTTSFINSAGLWNKTLPREIIAAVINVVLDVLFARKYGIGGIVFASLIASGLISLPYNILIVFKYVLNINGLLGLIKINSTIIISVVIGTITYYICKFIPLRGLSQLIVLGLICAIIPNILMFSIKRKTPEFRFVKSHLQLLLARRK